MTYNKHHEIVNSLHNLMDEDEDDNSAISDMNQKNIASNFNQSLEQNKYPMIQKRGANSLDRHDVFQQKENILQNEINVPNFNYN